MIIYIKNKHTLAVDDFKFKCCTGKNGKSKKKKEGDKKTPIGHFAIENLLSEDYIDNIRINAFGSRFYEPAPKISFMSGLKLNL